MYDTTIEPSMEEALSLTALPENELFARANALRQHFFGTRVSLCAIINARSGGCSMDCAFCSQSSRSHASIQTFPMLSEEELYNRILRMASLPVKHIGIVTSGGALRHEELTRVHNVLHALPEEIRSRICASFGRLPRQDLEQLVSCGLRRYHHNLETDASYYRQICTTQTWEQRRDTVLRAQKAQLEVCSGGLFGMGESWEDRCRFALALRALHVQNVPMNFLYPHPQTPLGTNAPLSASEALRIIALFRCILPQATLRICGGRPLVLGTRQREIFMAGANALMTGDYLTTAGQGPEQDLQMITNAGFEVVRP